MPVGVTMPALGESVTEGTVTRWLKRVGERIEVDEPLLEISTDKVDTEIVAPASGVLIQIKVAEDEVAQVGAELALIGEEGDAASASTPASTPSSPAAAVVPEPAAAVPPVSAGYVTPLVRRLAAEHRVDLNTLQGTGVGGRIRKSDVLAAAQVTTQQPEPQLPTAPAAAQPPPVSPAAAAAGPGGRTEPMSRLRQVIAARMVESLQTSAQLTAVVEVDVTRIVRLRAAAKPEFEAREGAKLTFLPFFAIAALEALKKHPQFNATADVAAKTITYQDAQHLGVAVDTDRGLIVPVIRNAGDLNLAGLAREIAELAARTRTNKVMPDELGGGTFTITNLGSGGVLLDTPIINQPQVALLFTGAIVKKPAVVNDPELGDVIAIRSMCYVGLTYDHRVIDGADAARFLATVKKRIEDGAFTAALGLS